MEIELDLSEIKSSSIILAVLLALVILAFGGYQVTPIENNRPVVLTYERYQYREIVREYGRDLANLRSDTEILVALVNAGIPNYIQIQVATEQILSNIQEGNPAQVVQRQLIAEAAQIVQAWGLGNAAYEDAVAAVQNAVDSVEAASDY